MSAFTALIAAAAFALQVEAVTLDEEEASPDVWAASFADGLIESAQGVDDGAHFQIRDRDSLIVDLTALLTEAWPILMPEEGPQDRGEFNMTFNLAANLDEPDAEPGPGALTCPADNPEALFDQGPAPAASGPNVQYRICRAAEAREDAAYFAEAIVLTRGGEEAFFVFTLASVDSDEGATLAGLASQIIDRMATAIVFIGE